MPILLADERGKAVGAVHAGWRGVIAGIAEVGVRAMEGLGARRRDIRAALGPSIGQCCFEVDEELTHRFAREIPGCGSPFRGAAVQGKAYLDLRAIVTDQLIAAGLAPRCRSRISGRVRDALTISSSRVAQRSSITGLQLSFISASRG